MKKLAALFILVALLAATRDLGSATASGKKPAATCWQAKFTFVNYPPLAASFAHWRIVQRGHIYAEGEFSFKGSAGGGYQRVISRCLTGINPWLRVTIKLNVMRYVACPNCDMVVAIRRTR